MHSSAIEIRSPAVSSMSISRPAGRGDTSWASRTRSSVVLPIADTTTTTSLPGAAGARRCARRPPGCGRGRRPTCRRTSVRAAPRPSTVPAGRAGPPVPRRIALLDSAPPSERKQAKRERQQPNREARREKPSAPPQAAHGSVARSRPARSSSSLVAGRDRCCVVFHAARQQRRRQRRHRQLRTTRPTAKRHERAAMTHRPDKTYTATIDTSQGTIESHLDPHEAPKTVEQLRLPRHASASTTASRSTASPRTSSSRAATRRATGAAGPATSVAGRAAHERLPGRLGRAGRRASSERRARRARSSSS